MNQNNPNQGIGNYKGLMICARPNDQIQPDAPNPFVSRVDPKERLGTNPVPHIQMNKPYKRVNYVLRRHKEWLEGFKTAIRESKNSKIQENLETVSRQNKSINQISRLREQFPQEQNLSQGPQFDDYNTKEVRESGMQNSDDIQINADQLERILNEPIDFNPQPKESSSHKNQKIKPSWAKTEKQLEEEELEQCDDLLCFASNLDYDKYINDLEVKSMVKAIKQRVSQINNQSSKQEQSNNDQKIASSYVQNDAKSEIREKSKGNGAISHKVEQTKEQREDWDKSTVGDKSKYKSNIEETLVRHLAEDILKNNKYLRGIHSVNSMKQVYLNGASN